MPDWLDRSFGELASVLRRGTAPTYVDVSPVRAIGQRCIRNDGFDASQARPHDARFGAVVPPQSGDVLINSTGTGTIGRSCVFRDEPGEFMVDGHVTLVRPQSEADGRFLNELVRSPYGQRFLESHCFTGSTNQIELSPTQLSQMPAVVPPLEEQRRIAEILDTIDETIQATERVLAKLSVVRKGLIADQLRLADGGCRVSLAAVAEISGGLALSAERAVPDAVELPYLRVANVQEGFIDTSRMRTVRVSRADVDRYAVRSGDVLLNEGGDFDKLGRGAVWDGRIDPCLHQNHVFRVRCESDRLLPEFLALFCQSHEAKSYFINSSRQTTNLASINKTQIGALPTLIPGLVEQRRIVDVLKATQTRVEAEVREANGLRAIRAGLAADLLSGRVRTVAP
jgi:type I restriction enzyme, S subunit